MERLKTQYKSETESKQKNQKFLSEDIKVLEEEQKHQRDEKENEEWNKIDEIKDKNKEQLESTTKDGLKSKAELTMTNNQYMGNKRDKDSKQRELEELSTQLSTELQQTQMLKQDIESQKNEIEERKKTIKDKQARIDTLHKKTQELEKFKFVLDYKIKELKRDIGPREFEILKLKEQTTKMDQEISHFTKINLNLKLIVEDLKMRQEGLQTEDKKQKKKLEEQGRYKKKFKDDVYECFTVANDYKGLKGAVIRLHKKYVKEEFKTDTDEADIEKEYSNKRHYLEKSVDNERKCISKNSQTYRKANNKYMKENVDLLDMINELRKLVNKTKSEKKAQEIAGLNMNQTG